jgi:hypothetical protein
MGWDWLDNIVSNVSSGLDFGKNLFSGAGSAANDLIHSFGWTNDDQYNEGKNVISTVVDTVDKVKGIAQPVKDIGASAKVVYDKAKPFAEDLVESFSEPKQEAGASEGRPQMKAGFKKPGRSSSFGMNRLQVQPVMKTQEPEKPKRRLRIKRSK